MTVPNDAAQNNRRAALGARFAGTIVRGRGIVLPSRLRSALFGLFLGGILTYGAGLAWYMLDRFDLINLISNTHDDAFYYFQIARNLAEGKFSTFDGGITRTNGYHPLWLFLITPFYWVFDKEAALFAIKAFEIMLIAGGVALVAAAARAARMPWYLLFAALPLLYRRPYLIEGMETAAALCMLGLFFLAVMLYARDSQRWQWPLAAVAFALPWVRLEYIAISLAATAALGLMEWSRQERAPGASLGERARSALSIKAVVPLLAAAAGILAYFAYNQLVFGGIVPVSGATKAARAHFKWEQEGGYSLAQSFWEVLQISVFDYELLVALEGLRLFAAGLVVRPPLPESAGPAAVGLSGGRVQFGRRPFGPIRTDCSHDSPFHGALALVFCPGVPDDGADCSRTMLGRHLLHSPVHRVEVAARGQHPEFGHRPYGRGLFVYQGRFHRAVSAC